LDPALSPGGAETWIISALFEPLIQPHPQTMAPMAGLATHYKIDRDGTRYTFYLRGHDCAGGNPARKPRLAAGRVQPRSGAQPHQIPARWSDGVPITAHDIVYSWRRYLAPETGCPTYVLYCVAGAEAVNQGRIPPGKLGKHCTIHFDEDPAFYQSLSDKLEKLIEAHRDNWEAMADGYEQIRNEAEAGRTETVEGLTKEATSRTRAADSVLRHAANATELEELESRIQSLEQLAQKNN
jgi:hypothetical protein